MPRHKSLVRALGTLGLVLLGGPVAAQRRTHPAGEVARRIPSNGHTYGVTIDPAGQVYVSQVERGELVRVDFTPERPPEVTSIGFQPPHVAVDPDGRSVFATLQGGRAVVRVSTVDGQTIDSVALGSDGFNLALDPDGAHLVATAAAGWAYRITRAPLRIVDSLFVGRSPNGVVFAPDGKRVYVSSRDAGTVTAIDAATFRQEALWTPGGQLQRIAIAPSGKDLYVADESPGGGVTRIDARTGKSRRFPMDGTPYGLAVTPDGQRLWVLLLDEGAVSIRKLPGLQQVASVEIGGRPRNIAFTSRGDRAAITTENAIILLR